jgi:hypothetical protein
MSMMVICPTRGRPKKAMETLDAWMATAVLPDSRIIFVVDKDDPLLAEYNMTALPLASFEHKGGGMAEPVNAAAKFYAPDYDILGFVGDDHRFRTQAWDEVIVDVLREKPGFAYANDLIRSDIPTQVFITSKVVQALGWMCLPGAKHLYLDNTWATLGKGAECISYVSSIVIEHCHPFFGRGEMDEGYARVNNPEMYDHDSRVFGKWLQDSALADIEKVRQAIK